MKKIRELVEAISEELNDAEKYATKAIAYKEEDSQLGDMYINLARQELDHASAEHRQAVRLIENYRNSGKTVPEAMQAVWDWQHEQAIEKESSVRIMIDMYQK